MEIKDRLKIFIDTKGINQAELSRLLNFGKGNISVYFSGKLKPGRKFLEKLKNTFPDLNTDWLLTGEGPMTLDDYQTRIDKEYEKSDDDLKIVINKYIEGRKGDKKALELLVKKLQLMIEMMDDE